MRPIFALPLVALLAGCAGSSVVVQHSPFHKSEVAYLTYAARNGPMWIDLRGADAVGLPANQIGALAVDAARFGAQGLITPRFTTHKDEAPEPEYRLVLTFLGGASADKPCLPEAAKTDGTDPTAHFSLTFCRQEVPMAEYGGRLGDGVAPTEENMRGMLRHAMQSFFRLQEDMNNDWIVWLPGQGGAGS